VFACGDEGHFRRRGEPEIGGRETARDGRETGERQRIFKRSNGANGVNGGRSRATITRGGAGPSGRLEGGGKAANRKPAGIEVWLTVGGFATALAREARPPLQSPSRGSASVLSVFSVGSVAPFVRSVTSIALR